MTTINYCGFHPGSTLDCHFCLEEKFKQARSEVVNEGLERAAKVADSHGLTNGSIVAKEIRALK